MSELLIPSTPSLGGPPTPRRRRPARRPQRLRRPRPTRQRARLRRRLPAMRAALSRWWGTGVKPGSALRQVWLPAAVAALVLASGAGVTAAVAGGEPEAPVATAGPAPSGNVAAWITQAEDVLAAAGWHATARDTADLVIIIQGESGGNPQAINLTDSNAAAGHPSKGLMQCIDGTFAEHALPGHTDIWNPVDNIIAGVRYALGRYGSLDDVPGVRAVHAGGRYIGY